MAKDLAKISVSGITVQCCTMSVPCGNPHCSELFDSPDDVIFHLEDHYSTCIPHFVPPQPEEYAFGVQPEELQVPFDRYQPFPEQPTNHPEPPLPPPQGRWTRYHPHSGAHYGKADNTLEQLDKDQYARRRVHNRYYPFADSEEWKLAKFINETMTLTQADQFLKLEWVCVLFSFSSCPLSDTNLRYGRRGSQ